MKPAAAAAILLLLSTLAAGAQEPPETAGAIPSPPSRPPILGTRGVVSSGHYLSTLAGIEVLRAGGNAFDAGVAAAMALKALRMDGGGWCGEAPVILYSARDGEVLTRTGAGTAPAEAAARLQPGEGALVPADVDVWTAVLARYGTRAFADVARWALDIAENGYPLYRSQMERIERDREAILRRPANAGLWYPSGADRRPRMGDPVVNPGLARLLRYLIAAERKALEAGASRAEAIRFVRDAFYAGEPARAAEASGVLRYADMAGYEGKWAPALPATYREYEIRVPEGWTQGPALILMLNMLEGFDLQALGFNTPAYIHLLSQAADLAMADCRRYVGDPDFNPAPTALYSKEYAQERARLIRPDLAFADRPPWGDPVRLKAVAADWPAPGAVLGVAERAQGGEGESAPSGASSLSVADGQGNLFSMTVSGGQAETTAGADAAPGKGAAGSVTPLIPGWGFGLGGAMGEFDPGNGSANRPAPGKRPRLASVPMLVLKDGRPFLALSASGSGRAAQALLQVFLNIVVWGMDPQAAVDQPRFGGRIDRGPAGLNVEEPIPPETVRELEAKGQPVRVWRMGSSAAGAPAVTGHDPDSGLLTAAADERGEAYALGF